MIECVLIDFGGVLAYPATGNWFITPKTAEIIGNQAFISLMARPAETRNAFHNATAYLSANHLMHTVEEEIEHFFQFYRIFLTDMGMAPTDDICWKLAVDIVRNDEKFCFYDDVMDGLKEIRRHYRVAILSHTWPSLGRVLDRVGISPFLDARIFSCEHGETKEGTKLFEIALSTLKADPDDILFVDDHVLNLNYAKKVGLIPVLMDRDNQYDESQYPIVRNINDILKILRDYAD